MCKFLFQLDEDEFFNFDYIEVYRVLDVFKFSDSNGGDDIIYFLVKWKGLFYEEVIWELQQDVDFVKVEYFYKFRELLEDVEVIIVLKIYNINIIFVYFYNIFFVNRKKSILQNADIYGYLL